MEKGHFIVVHPKHGYYVEKIEPKLTYTKVKGLAHIFTDENEAYKFRTNPTERVINLDEDIYEEYCVDCHTRTSHKVNVITRVGKKTGKTYVYSGGHKCQTCGCQWSDI